VSLQIFVLLLPLLLPFTVSLAWLCEYPAAN